MRADPYYTLEAALLSIAQSLYWAMDEVDSLRPAWRSEVPELAQRMEIVLDQALPRAS